MSEHFLGVPSGLCRRVGGGIEGCLLADAIKVAEGERIAELGCGCGEVVVRLALAHPGVMVDGLEIQPALCAEARRLVAAHGLTGRVVVLEGDVRAAPVEMRRGGYAQVVCNPPFFVPEAGRMPVEPARALARFELAGGLEDFLRCGAALLQTGGWMELIHRPERLVEIFALAKTSGLHPERMVPIHARAGREAILVRVGLRKGGGAGLVIQEAMRVEGGVSGV
ncbi:MAG: methyltransferase [Magnetococcus sp. YQC-9]